jgi:hypothetical protein
LLKIPALCTAATIVIKTMESQRKRIDTPGLGASEVDSEEEFDSETIVVNDNVETSPVPEEDTYNGFWQREAKRMARIPRIYLGAASLISVVLSVVVRSLV